MLLVVGAVAGICFLGWLTLGDRMRAESGGAGDVASPDPLPASAPAMEPELPMVVDSDAVEAVDPPSRPAAGIERRKVWPRDRWVRELKAAKDSPRLQEVLIALEAALEGPDPQAARQALLAIAPNRELQFMDWTRFHGAVVPHLESKDPALRATAIWALCACGPRADDRNHILPLAKDPDVRVRVAVGARANRCF